MDIHARATGDDRSSACDLASIVLAHGRRDRPQGAPEQVPVDVADRSERDGFDARSVIVLALVVAVLASVVGWVATGRTPEPTAPAAKPASADVGAEAKSGQRVVSDATTPATPAIRGVDLALGRVASTSTGTGIATLSIGIANRGSRDFAAVDGASVLVIVDGAIGATQQLPAIEAGASTKLDVRLNWCPAGAVPVTVVLDPGAVVREADERNGSISRAVDFGC